jgi:hypothetical protein
MSRRLAALVLVAGVLAGSALADEKSDVEAFMADYLVAWNAHDASAITSTYYRLDSAHPWATEAGMKAEFDRLKADGYDKSDTSSIKGCILGGDTAQVELRYVRLKTDGSFMPPKDRASIYRLRKFADGWRVTGFSGLDPAKQMDCPAG